MTAEPRAPWERLDGETPTAYSRFRSYRDLPPESRSVRAACGLPLGARLPRHVERWASLHGWSERAASWDDAQHVAEDRARLAAIRTMHRTHEIAARSMMSLALQALRQLQPDTMTASEVIRLLDASTQLERRTLTTSVTELQTAAGLLVDEDPWARIAAELTGT